MTESFGMMEGAFFVGKNEILKWINTTYQLNMSKIEQACTGAVYCQIIDSVHNNKVKMHKVNWKARLEHEYIPNYKILQQAFNDCKISKNIEVEKLVKGKHQDNLEFLQWMKRYFDEKQIQRDYDPIARRGNHELEICNENTNYSNIQRKRDNSKPHLPSSIKFAPGALKTTKSVEKLTNFTPIQVNNIIPKESPFQSDQMYIFPSENLTPILPIKEIEPAFDTDKFEEATETLRQHYQERLDVCLDEISKLNMEISTLKMSMSEVGNQRDFYFSKLRDVEILTVKNSNLDREGLVNILKTIIFSEKEIELQFDDTGNVTVKNY